MLTHGMYGTKPYACWQDMRNRCYRKKNRDYKNYGALGITVCKRWRESFIAFWADMGPTYRPGLTIDRINPRGNYTPKNCRWITKLEQCSNRRNNRFIETQWGRITIAEAARRSGFSRQALRYRLDNGCPLARLFEPADKGRQFNAS
jgi:hypothetical protein